LGGKLKSVPQVRIVGADRRAAANYPPEAHGAASKQYKEIGKMEAKPAQQNIQDSFLNTARKERHNITIYLVSGVKLTGRIRSFDKYSVVLETSNQEQLIFKHAISTVVISRGAHSHAELKPAAVASPGEASIPSPASGTEG
jgi:host factor-I protein